MKQVLDAPQRVDAVPISEQFRSKGDTFARPAMSEPEPPNRSATPRVELCRSGIRLAQETLPLHAGSVHYWRLETRTWKPALESVKSMGLRFVDTYIPWGVHEKSPGTYDFGSTDPRLDVHRFIEIARDLELLVIVRPGPHINAELTFFGIPERVIWNSQSQARSAGGKPVILPVPPLAFPVPSYAAEAFLVEACAWLSSVSELLDDLCWPNGPIVLVQVDNEGALYFRDGVYDQDYHPDAITKFRTFLQRKYRTTEALRVATGDPSSTFDTIEPPRKLAGSTALDLAVHMDWAEAQEELVAGALGRMRSALGRSGLGLLPTVHNMPPGETSTPLDPDRLSRVVDLVGLDYYFRASAGTRREIARRTSELAVRSTYADRPAFAAELGAGFPPFFPPLVEADSEFTALTALAYGIRGFNVYMAVERDRWIGAPVDHHGQRRPFADFWEQLCNALERTRFSTLERHTPVRIVVPRSVRRLMRVLHAFGPLSLAAFHISGEDAETACYEDEFGLGGPIAVDTARFLRSFERALESACIPFAVVGGDMFESALRDASWTILVCSGALESDIVRELERAWSEGRAVSVGPHFPARNASFLPLDRVPSIPESSATAVPEKLGMDEAGLRDVVTLAAQRLSLATLNVEPADIFATLHEDSERQPRVLFVINPTGDDVTAKVRIAGVTHAKDALDGATIHATVGALELELRALSVRMLELSS